MSRPRKEGPAPEGQDLCQRCARLAFLGCLGVLVAIGLAVWQFGGSGFSGSTSTHTPEAPLGIISLQLAFTARRANGIIASWSGPTLEEARHATFLDWFPFIPSYVVLLFLGATAAAFSFSWHQWSPLAGLGKIVTVAIIVAGLFDCIENMFLLCMINRGLSGETVEGRLCPVGSGIFASAKIVLLLVAILYVLGGLSSWLWGLIHQSLRNGSEQG